MIPPGSSISSVTAGFSGTLGWVNSPSTCRKRRLTSAAGKSLG
jgi:hypothetical protein